MKTVSKSISDPRRSLLALAAASAALAILAPTAARGDSLWPTTGGGAERPMFADRKAAAPGDILTVVVQEDAAAVSSSSKSTTRKSALSDAVQQYLFSPGASAFGTKAGEVPAVILGGSSSSSGGGAVNNSQSLSSRAAVLVTDVLPNGNLVIQGVRVVTFAGETQYVVLHGLVRSDDITSTNSVLSSNIADARVEFVSKGSISDAEKRGWLTKVYEKLRPF